MYYHEFHAPISCHNHLEKEKRATNQSPYDYTFTVLSMPRDLLYTRINQRVDEMINLGLVEEVRYFFEKGYDEQCTAMKAIGYKEFFPYFRGEASLEVCIEKLKQATRHYAKRQLTWFRHQTTPIMIDVAALHFDTTQIASEICKNFNV
jgi:tRNA dimethylallyltransferase